jgi:hypothetical protein
MKLKVLVGRRGKSGNVESNLGMYVGTRVGIPQVHPLPYRRALPSFLVKTHKHHRALSVAEIVTMVRHEESSQPNKQDRPKEATQKASEMGVGHGQKPTSLSRQATGVYFDNVEIKGPMHPLQGPLVNMLAEQLKGTRSSVIGRPLPSPPSLPQGVVQLHSFTRPSVTSTRVILKEAISISKKRASKNDNKRSVRRRYSRMTDDEKVFVEAATALCGSSVDAYRELKRHSTKYSDVVASG